MSGNGSYIKSMNGIVSFDTNGTTIEGDVITTGTIDSTTINCVDLNASASVNTPYIKTDFIFSDTNLGFLSNASTIYNFLVPTKLASDNSTNSASTAYVTTAINNLRTGTITWGGTQNFQGSDITVTTKAAANNSTFAASTAYVTTAIANVLNGANYSGAQNFTGAVLTATTQTNLVNNTTVATTAFANTAVQNLLNDANVWTQAQNFTGAVLTAFTQVASDISTKVATTNFVSTALTNLKAGTTWTGNQIFTSATITATTQAVGNSSNLVATTAFVLANAGSAGLLASNNVWTGTNEFGTITTNTGNFNNSSATTTCRLFQSTTDAVINIGQNQTSGGLFIGAAPTRIDDITIGSTTCNTTFRSTISVYNKINVHVPANTFDLLDNLTLGNLNIANNQTAGVINIGQNKTSGWVLLGSASVPIIIKGTASCEKDINLGNSTSTNIYSTNVSAPFQIKGENTLNVIGSGLSKFGSWNNGNVELGTQSFSNIVIGAGGSGANLKTTTIKGTLIADGSGGGSTTLWGLLSYVTTSVNYTIVITDINSDFYLTITGINPRSIIMPARKLGQKIHIRNLSAVNQLLSCVGSSGNFYNPNNNTASLTYSLPSTNSVNYFDNGTDLIAF
jgi:hypothetical protein